MDKIWCIYILLCSDGTYYVGSTNNLERRLGRHNSGDGAKYTRGRRPVKIVWSQVCDSKNEALSREVQIKRWSRQKKEKLVSGKR